MIEGKSLTRFFGVGCFQLRPSDNAGGDFDVVQLKKDIISSFENIENVRDVVSSSYDDDYLGFHSFESDEEGIVWPVLLGFQLSFSIYIPKKIQQALQFEVSSENFFVILKHEYDKPVIVVTYEADANPMFEQSEYAVALLREYIKEKLGSKIVMSIVGPSPFHANFFVNDSENHEVEFADFSPPLGIGRYSVSYDQSIDSYPLELFVHRYGEIFSRFYYLQSMKSKISSLHFIIVNQIMPLLNRESEGFFKDIRYSIQSKSTIDSVRKCIVEEYLFKSEMIEYIDTSKNRGGIALDSPFSSHFREFESFLETSKVSAFDTVATFFEDRRQKLISNLSGVVTGLIGGIVGALIGAAATATLSRPATTSISHQSATPPTYSKECTTIDQKDTVLNEKQNKR